MENEDGLKCSELCIKIYLLDLFARNATERKDRILSIVETLVSDQELTCYLDCPGPACIDGFHKVNRTAAWEA